MKANIAVATVQGKAYYLIVNELKKRNIDFFSLTPNEPVPIEVKAVITTERELPQVKHDRLIVFKEGENLEKMMNEALQIIRGKEHYDRITIGIDPGDVLGLAVLADGKVTETANCSGLQEIAVKIENLIANYNKISDAISVKIGNGVPQRKEELLRELDEILPSNVRLESVSEAGTSRNLNETKHRRGLRDIASAIKIAGRNGQIYKRASRNE